MLNPTARLEADQGRPPIVGAPFLTYAPHLLALTVVLLAVAIVRDPRTSASIIGVTSAVFSVFITLYRGRSYLPPSSIYFLASGVFIGGAVYYLLLVDSEVSVRLIRDAAALALISTIGMAIVVRLLSERWALQWPGPEAIDPRRRPLPSASVPLFGIGLMILSQIPLVASIVGPTSYSIGLAGVMLMVVWSASRWRRVRWFGDLFVVALVFVLPWMWVQLTFSGGGRLMIAGVSIASFMIWNFFNPSRVQKLLVILCIPLFLIFAGLSRAKDSDNSTSGSVIASGDGLASVYVPLETFAREIGPLTVAERELLGPRMGETFLHSFYLPIPRAIWPDKPAGFGAELTEVLEPRLTNVNHSMAALSQGEWYANFGYWGIVLIVPATGWFLAWMDRRHVALLNSDFREDVAFWRLAIAGCLASSLGDLCWVGTFMIYARGGLAALVLWGVSFVALGRRRPGAVPGNWYSGRTGPSARRRDGDRSDDPTPAVSPT